MIEYKSSVDIAANLSVKGRITSRLADGGLSPLDVLSKVLNVNLNAEFLGGYDAIKFPRKIENAAITGTWGFLFAPTITTASTAPTAAARYDQITSLSGAIDARTITINGTAGRVSVTGGTQSLALSRTWSVDLAASGVVAGTGTKVVVDTYGRVTGFVSATTVAAYGITDILAQVLTGYTAGSNTALSSSDTILQAFGKVQGQINNISTTGITGSGTLNKIMKFTGSRSAGDSIISESGINIFVAGNIVSNYTAGTTAGLIFQSGGVTRWQFQKYGAESGSNAGGNLLLYAVDDAGSGIGNVFTIARATRKFNFDVVPSGPGPSAGGDYVNLTYANATYVPLTRTVTASTGLTGGGALSSNISLALAASGVTAGTGTKVTVDTYGRVTGFVAATTLAGYGITDALSGTGTSGYVLKYTGANTVSAGLLYDSGSRIGIGTASPGARFHIYGTETSTGTGAAFVVQNSASTLGNAWYFLTGGAGTPYADNSLIISDNYAYRFSIGQSGHVGIGLGTTGASERLEVGGKIKASGQFISTQATGTAPLVVASTTYVPNLNVNYVNGRDEAYLLSRANHTGIQSLTAGTGLSGTAYNGLNAYTWSLASGVVTPGTYQKITLDTYGRGIAGANLNSADIITALGYTPGSGSGSIGGGGTSGYVAVFQAGGVNIQNSRLYDSGSGRVATVSGAGFQSAGDILAGGDIDCGVNTFFGNKAAINVAEFANTLVVGGSSIGSGLAFEVRGTTKASRPFPKMTRAQRLALSPSEGDFVFQTEIVGASARGVKYYDGTAWTHMDFNAGAA